MTGEVEPVVCGQVLGVVGEVGVAGAGDHPGHRVQTHPVDGGVWAAASRPDEDGAGALPLPQHGGGLPQEGEEGGLAQPAGGLAVRPGQEHQLGDGASRPSVPHLERPHQEVSHLPLRLQLELVGPDELGAGEEGEVVTGGAGDEGEEELHLGLPDGPPDAPVRQRAGGEDADEGRRRLPAVHVSHHGASLSSAEVVITPLESFKVFNKGQVPRSVETLEVRGTMLTARLRNSGIYLDVFGEERGRDVGGRVPPPASGGYEAGRGEVLAGGEDGHDLVLSSLPPAAQGDGEYEHDGGDDGQHHGDHHHVEALTVEGDHLCLDLAVGADKDLLVGGEVGLVQPARLSPGPGDGGHRQAVRGEVPQVTEPGLVVRVRSVPTLRVSHQVQVRGVGAAHVDPPLEVILVLP